MKELSNLFFMALYIAFAVSLFYQKVISPEPFRSEINKPRALVRDGENRVLVVASEVNLVPGFGPIDESFVKRIKYPERLLPRYASLDVKDVLGCTVHEHIYRGEVVSLQRLIDHEVKDGPVGAFKPEVWQTIVISGGRGYEPILARGLSVDIAAQYFTIPYGKRSPVEISRTIVRKARVLEFGSEARKRLKDRGLASDDEAVTFALTKQAKAIIDLIKVQPKASFHIILRSVKNSEDPDTEGYGMDQLRDDKVKRSFSPEESPVPFDLAKLKSLRATVQGQTEPVAGENEPDVVNEDDSPEAIDFGDFEDFDAFDGFH